MPEMTRHTRKMLVAALLAGLTLASCGGDDNKDSNAVTAAGTPTTTTAPPATTATTETKKKATTTLRTTKTAQPIKVTPVEAPPRSLKANGLKVDIDVDSIADPVRADVDEPQAGNRFIGVFLKSQATGKYEPSKVTAVAALNTVDGKSY